jgi:hypothetical protein
MVGADPLSAAAAALYQGDEKGFGGVGIQPRADSSRNPSAIA